MTPIAPRVLHILCTAFLVVAFLASFVGGYAIANDSGEGGANIGAGLLMLLSALFGAIGLVLGIAALVAVAVTRRRPSPRV
ncbi:hypothetical protein [Curtobacterium aurantiacum]|uniref:hypothetical protein n=1 Tax=Curtobacterium aurantiacum TaxID=3236919 RepID=UPI001BE06E50|nr:hypothetical protein [Curtobacterium flaccumfaciens]MBT1674866.1 hypothetical protein [Curtobacterium flaccumfaciens pv. flaccumfaciens]